MALMWVPAILLILVLNHGVGGDCPDDWIDCQNGECIAVMWRCDGENDCGNNLDEKDCASLAHASVNCTDAEFKCAGDDSCIPLSWRCDGHYDCLDTSDEVNCESDSSCHGFRCKNNVCIPSKWKCDGRSDCPDNSDEDSCPGAAVKLCADSEFTCGSGSCLDLKKVCDGKKDCPDGSDEGGHCIDKCSNATCSQECRSSPRGPECYCKDGYKLNARDKKTCSDIDECAEEGFCSQHCTNLLGSYKCSCLDGYDLENNTCRASGPEPVIIFATLDDIRAMYLRSKRYFPVHKAEKASSVDADPLNSRVYWVEISNRPTVKAIDIDGSRLETVMQTGLMVPEGIAVDYLGRNLYFTDSGLKQVLVCKIDGSMCHMLHDTNIQSPRAIALDITEGLMYWSDWGNASAGIYRSGMDGSRRVSLVSKDIKWPNGIAVDHTTNRLYWSDALLATIEYITLDGKTRKVIVQDENFHPYSMSVFEDNIYWSDWNSYSLDHCNKFSGHRFGVLVREKKHIMGVHVYHPVLAKRNNNPCWNHPCSHMCLIAPLNDFTCACPRGYKLSSDGRRCSFDNSFPMLLVNDETNIYQVRPESVGSLSVDEVPITHMENIGRLAYDWQTKTLYIIDPRKPAIYSIVLATRSRRELARNHLVMPGDLAFDWLNGNLYWVDSSKGTVEVVSTSTTRTAIIVVDLSKPTAIALMPTTSRMFISTTGEDQSVAMYDMDGKNRKVLIGAMNFIVALAVHPTLSFLYMVDPRAETISSINYLSPVSNPTKIQLNTGSILSIAVDEKYVYWTESTKHVLNYKSQNGSTMSYNIALPGQKSGLASRKVIYASEPPKNRIGLSNCEMNGGCAYLCLGSPNGRTCVCPMGMQLSKDGRTCTEKECTRDEFRCTKSKKCVPHEFVCDGVQDCDDGSDESCTGTEKQSRCPGDDFRCRNGRCIMSTWKCDHRDDCGDGSDEVGCPPPTSCGKDQYQCTDAECIPLLWRCDGEFDCNDHSDEAACNATSCSPDIQLRCDHGQCIPKSWACDGTNDCFDGTDERNCSSAEVCDSKQFKCDNEDCIDKQLVCDQRSDCKDGSDEKNCSKETCKEGKYPCAGGEVCIYLHEVCDQTKDCPHGDDEVNCTRQESDCTPDQYFCKNNSRCISRGWLCDGDNDCGDASDENPDNCTRRIKPTLPPHTAFLECEEFFCGYSGECIPFSKLCDGVNDCRDLSDEGGSCPTACLDSGCSQLCQKTPQGSKCSCYPGYTLLPDEVTCEDLNECEVPGSCSQFCSNTKGGFKCSCAEDYLLELHTRCKAVGGPATLAYLLPDQIRGVDLGGHNTRVYVSQEDTNMKGMDYDAAKGVVFWTELKEGKVYRYNPYDKKREVLLSTVARPQLLRWDWIAENLYLTTNEATIVTCDGDGKFCATIVTESAGHINGFDIAPKKGVMFWCVWGMIGKRTNGVIRRAELDGSHPVDIVKERLQWPNTVTVDHVMEMIYWVDYRMNVLECVNFRGTQRRKVVAEGLDKPYTMTLFEDYAYVSDWGSDTIMKCSKHTDNDCKELHRTNTKAYVFMVVHKVNQPKGENKCHNSGCPHLCLPTRTSFSCMCDRNYVTVNGSCLQGSVDVTDTTTQKSKCDPNPCKNEARCEDSGGTYLCVCPDGVTGDKCDVKQASLEPAYDYSWVEGLVLAILSVVLIVLVAIYCRMKRDKLARLSESVGVTFRKGRKSGRLITDDGGDQLVIEDDPKGFGNPLFGKKPRVISDPESPQTADGDFKRWPSFDSADSAFASEGSQLRIDASPLSGSSDRFFKR